jgi:glycosyltransferase involved in cell wall biosynthesis
VRILHVTTHWTGGGSERNIKHHLECLVHAGHDVDLAVGRDQQPALLPFPEGARVLTVRSLQRRPGPVADAAALLTLRRIVRDGYDLVHTHLSKAGVLGRLAVRGGAAAVFHTVHGPQMLANPAYRLAERTALRRTDLTIAVGQELCDRYVRELHAEGMPTAVVRSPVDVDALRAVPPPAPSGSLTALVASRLVPRKRLELLPEILAATPPHVRALVAGEGPLKTKLAAIQKRRGVGDRLQLLGWLPFADAVRRADLVLNLSGVEGLPQTVVQGIAAHRPVIAVPANGVGEVIVDGINGLLLPDASAATVARALTRVAGGGLLQRLVAGCGATDLTEWRSSEVCMRHLELLALR